jgi:hypothetical protein
LEDKLLPRVSNWVHALTPNTEDITASQLFHRETQIFEVLDAEPDECQLDTQAPLITDFRTFREASFVRPSVRAELVPDQEPYTFSIQVWLDLTDEQKKAVHIFEAAPAFDTQVWVSVMWICGDKAWEREHGLSIAVDCPNEWRVTLDHVEPDKPFHAFIKAQYSGGTCYVRDWRPDS